MTPCRIENMFNVYDKDGEAWAINVYYQFGRYEIRKEHQLYATAENRNEVDDEIKDLMKAEGLSFVRPL